MKYWRTPFDMNRISIPKGELHIIKDRCKGCGFCVEYCPRDVLELSSEFNIKGYHPPKAVQPDNCVNCDLCERICPEFAIFCITIEENPTETQPEEQQVERG
jgi:2-oxoglutarate ferredoxin oxidoreductase subunit delta